MPERPAYAGVSVAISTANPATVQATSAPGVSTQVSASDHAHALDPTIQGNAYIAQDHGGLTWSFDPSNCNGSFALATAGTIYGIRLHWAAGGLTTGVIIQVPTAGAGLTANQCFAALYNTAKNLVSVSADQSGAYAGTGTITIPWSTNGGPQTLVAGDVFVVFWFNGTTGPSITRGTNTGAANLNLSAANSRYFSANTGITTQGTAPATLGAFTALNNALFAMLY